MPFSRRHFLHQLGLAGVSFGALSLLPGCSSVSRGHLRSTPEAEGISSQAILNFLDAIQQSRHEFHSVMLSRHGRVIAEGWWAPYRAELNHTMYSMSKSFTSTAVGLAVSEGRLSVDDKVISFFPDDLPKEVSENLAALRVRDLLSMSVGHQTDPTFSIIREQNWVKAFLAWPIPHKPGSLFVYNSGATYICSAIVQKVTGQKVIDYLRPRLFDPLEIKGMTWEEDPRGINVGGWGLNIRTEGLCKFGNLFLQEGRWKGRQVLPASWVEEATSFKIQQPGGADPKNDWKQGYAYQFWRSQHGAYRGDGAFGQYTVIMPEQEAVIAITSETPDMQGELDLVWKHLLPAMGNSALPENLGKSLELKKRLHGLALSLPAGEINSAVAREVSGQKFTLDQNALGLDAVSFHFVGNTAEVEFQTGLERHIIPVGFGEWRSGATALPGTPPRLVAGGAPPKGTTAKVASSAAWRTPNQLEMHWRYHETPHSDRVTAEFKEGKVQIRFVNSIARGGGRESDGRPVLTGKVA